MPDTNQEDLTISFEGKTYTLDDFELGELEELEEELGFYFNEIGSDPEATRRIQSMKAAVRLVWVLKRRENPEFTIDDARKVKLSVFADPSLTNGNGNGTGTGKGRKRPTRAATAAKT